MNFMLFDKICILSFFTVCLKKNLPLSSADYFVKSYQFSQLFTAGKFVKFFYKTVCNITHHT